ncbi:hypothetical protein BJ165DRAFT_1404625 [Panaeolus papilionaceus]|nr:hypothetical protein BJ165DRAFT_1404625 [Panaeolus papilionaceus]
MSHKQISNPQQMPQAALTTPQPEGGFTIYGETISTSFVVDEQGRLSPCLSDYLAICNSPAYQDKLLEVFLWKWKWTGPPTAPQIQSITQEVCDIINHALGQCPRMRKLAIDTKFLEAAQCHQLKDIPSVNEPRLRQLAIRSADTISNKAIVRHLFSIIGPNFWSTSICVDGRTKRWDGPNGMFVMGLHRQFIGLTTLQLDQVTIWDWLHLVRDLPSLAHVTVTAMRDSVDDPRIEYVGLRDLESIDLSVHAEEAMDKKILMRALRPLRTPHLKKLSLANDYLWSRSSIDDLLSEFNCYLEEFTANNMPGLTPNVLADFLCHEAVGESLKKLHINPGPYARFQLFDTSHGQLVQLMSDMEALPDLEEFSFPLCHVAYPSMSRTELREPSPIFHVLGARVAQTSLRRITCSTPDPRAIKTQLSTYDYRLLMHLKKQPGVRVCITDDEFDL